MIEYLESCNVKYTIVHTKCDVAGTPKRLAQATYTYLGHYCYYTTTTTLPLLHYYYYTVEMRTAYHARHAACALHARGMHAACACACACARHLHLHLHCR
jgi:hypothetical protein